MTSKSRRVSGTSIDRSKQPHSRISYVNFPTTINHRIRNVKGGAIGAHALRAHRVVRATLIEKFIASTKLQPERPDALMIAIAGNNLLKMRFVFIFEFSLFSTS